MRMVKFKSLHDDAKLPLQGTDGAAGYDLVATTKGRLKNGIIEYGTGLAVAIPTGYAGFIYPRSSISNKDMGLANSVGVIDSDYRGEIKIRMRVLNLKDVGRGITFTNSDKHYNVGDRIGQIVFHKVEHPVVRMFPSLGDPTERGEGGFGHTGE